MTDTDRELAAFLAAVEPRLPVTYVLEFLDGLETAVRTSPAETVLQLREHVLGVVEDAAAEVRALRTEAVTGRYPTPSDSTPPSDAAPHQEDR